MVFDASLPPSLWPESIHLATMVTNVLPTSNHGSKPTLHHLHPFGTRAYVQRHTIKGKFTPRCDICMYLGPDEKSHAARFWNPDSRTIIVSSNYSIKTVSPPTCPTTVKFTTPAPHDEDVDDIAGITNSPALTTRLLLFSTPILLPNTWVK